MDNRPQTRGSISERRAEMLDQLLRDHRARLLRQVRFHARNSEEAEEALAEASVQFMRHWDLDSGFEPLPWMLVVAKRCAWAIARKERRRESRRAASSEEPLEDEISFRLPSTDPGPAELVERSQDTKQLIERLEDLKPDERTALILLGLGCSYAEIAALRGWTLTKVNRCIAEGRARVRQALEEGER